MLRIEQRLKMLQVPEMPIDVVLDTDAYNEIDDQFAIAYALKSKEKIHLKALYAAPFFNHHSSSPEDGMERSYDEILKLLKLTGDDVPVLKGSRTYLKDEKTFVESPAARDLAKRAMEYSSDRPLYVVAIGAITNVASALLMESAIADRIVIVWLGGGALEMPENREFNLSQDIAAARVVMGSGAPFVMLPCAGVVSAFTTTEPEMRYWLSGKNELSDYLVENTVSEANAYAKGKVWSRVIWDVCTIGWLLNDGNQFMCGKFIHTPIPEYDHHWAMSSSRPICMYVYAINRDALMGDLFEKLCR